MKSYLITHGPRPYIRFVFEMSSRIPKLAFTVVRNHGAIRLQWECVTNDGQRTAHESEAFALLNATRAIRYWHDTTPCDEDPERFDGMS